MTLSGKRRLLLRFPGILEFHDVSRDGRVVFARVGLRPGVIGLPPGESKERTLTWLDASGPADLSRDGKTLLISEIGEGGGTNQSIYLRKTDGFRPLHRGRLEVMQPVFDARGLVFGQPFPGDRSPRTEHRLAF